MFSHQHYKYVYPITAEQKPHQHVVVPSRYDHYFLLSVLSGRRKTEIVFSLLTTKPLNREIRDLCTIAGNTASLISLYQEVFLNTFLFILSLLLSWFSDLRRKKSRKHDLFKFPGFWCWELTLALTKFNSCNRNHSVVRRWTCQNDFFLTSALRILSLASSIFCSSSARVCSDITGPWHSSSSSVCQK